MKGKKALILASLLATGLLFVAPGITGSQEPSVPVAINPELFQAVIIPKEDEALPVIIEPHAPTHPSSRPEVKVAEATTKTIVKATPKPKVQTVIVGTSHSVSGNASWYCKAGRSPCRVGYPDTSGSDYYAAAGPALRTAIGGRESSTAYKGKVVRVCGNECINVKLVDWCQCYYKQPHEKVIDLYWDAWIDVNSGGYVKISW